MWSYRQPRAWWGTNFITTIHVDPAPHTFSPVSLNSTPRPMQFLNQDMLGFNHIWNWPWLVKILCVLYVSCKIHKMNVSWIWRISSLLRMFRLWNFQTAFHDISNWGLHWKLFGRLTFSSYRSVVIPSRILSLLFSKTSRRAKFWYTREAIVIVKIYNFHFKYYQLWWCLTKWM